MLSQFTDLGLQSVAYCNSDRNIDRACYLAGPGICYYLIFRQDFSLSANIWSIHFYFFWITYKYRSMDQQSVWSSLSYYEL